jgi:hypothetical protein
VTLTLTKHPVAALFDRLGDFRYPPNVSPTDEVVPGPEFFPGGSIAFVHWNRDTHSAGTENFIPALHAAVVDYHGRGLANCRVCWCDGPAA